MWFYILVGVVAAIYILNIYLAKKNTSYGITFIAGEIGAGKSTLAVKYARKHLKKGWNVYSTDYIKGCYMLDVTDLNTLMAKPKSLLIIDEASLKMNSRDFAKLKLSLIEYFKLCRHCKNRVILISQTMTDTDKQIRDLAANVLFVRKFINGIVSLTVKVKSGLGIGQDGQPTMMYKIGHFGSPILLFRYRKYFNSFDDFHRDYIADVPWSTADIVKPVENKRTERSDPVAETGQVKEKPKPKKRRERTKKNDDEVVTLGKIDFQARQMILDNIKK